jgi:hypothetical protein
VGKTRRSREDRRRAAQEREEAKYPLLAGQDDPAMRAKLTRLSRDLREHYSDPSGSPPSPRNPAEDRQLRDATERENGIVLRYWRTAGPAH